MNLELAFSAAGLLSMAGWLLLIASPVIPDLSNRISGLLIPTILCAGTVVLAVWMCRTARQQHINFKWVLPCLPLTFLFGPAGFLAFSLVRCFDQTNALQSQ